MVDKFLLSTGADVPFTSAQLILHQPKLSELAFLKNERDIFGTLDFLTIKSDNFITGQDSFDSKSISDFDILMSMMNYSKKTVEMQQRVNNIIIMLQIIFPNYNVNVLPNSIILIENENNEEDKPVVRMIDNNNFMNFKDYISDIFCLQRFKSHSIEYNPNGELSGKIAKKLQERKRKLAEIKKANGETVEEVSIIEKYASILAVGLKLNINEIYETFTLYQLFEQFERYEKKLEFDTHLKAQLAGATGMKPVDHWML